MPTPPLQGLGHRRTRRDGIESGANIDNDGERDDDADTVNSVRGDGDDCLATWQHNEGRSTGQTMPTPPMQGLSHRRKMHAGTRIGGNIDNDGE